MPPTLLDEAYCSMHPFHLMFIVHSLWRSLVHLDFEDRCGILRLERKLSEPIS